MDVVKWGKNIRKHLYLSVFVSANLLTKYQNSKQLDYQIERGIAWFAYILINIILYESIAETGVNEKDN